jgi:hypothetical protein
MTNLGKILLTFIITHTIALATFKTSVSQTKVSQGDEVVLTFFSNVSDNFPIISDIAGLEIVRQSRESSTSYINGVRTGNFKKHYIFVPSADMTIPSYSMKENGKEVKSKPIKITVSKAKYDNASGDLFFKAYLSKKEVLVGEPFFVTLVYKQAKDMEIVDRRLVKPAGKHFWVEDKPIETANESTSHLGVKIKYIFTAQKSGELTIDPAHIKVGEAAYMRDAWGNLRGTTRYKTLFTDKLSINVKPLPHGIDNVGDFKMDVSVDKKSSNEKDAVNVTVTIKGEGNIADIPAFKLPLDSVLVYDEKPKKEHAYKDGKYQGTFTQKFAIVSDHNYTIPKLDFSFYSLKKKKTIALKSKPIDITIKPTSTASKMTEVKVEKGHNIVSKNESTTIEKERSWLEIIIAMIVGIFIGLIIKSIRFNFKPKKREHRQNLKGERNLLQALMPYSDQDSEAKEFVEILSSNIYDKSNQSYDKKALKKLLKRLGIKA